MTYLYFYYLIAVFCLPLVVVSVASKGFHNNSYIKFDSLLIGVLSFTYLVAMARQDGIDYSNYVSTYYTNYPEIPDLGFNGFMNIFRTFGLDFEFMVILIGIITISALRRAALYFAVNFSAVLAIYLLHLAVVRDFAQLRSGFAIALAVYALTLPNFAKKWMLYLLGASMHYSIIPFIIAYEFCRFISGLVSYRRQIFGVISAAVLIFIISQYLGDLAFMDSRIELYLSWEAENYGSPVSQFSTLLFQVFLLILAYYSRNSWIIDKKIRALVYLQFLGIVFFVAFKDVAIIAFRVSGAILSLYPFLFIFTLMHFRLRFLGRSFARVSSAFIFLIISIVLLFRQGSYEIIESIDFGNYPGGIGFKLE